VAHHEPEELPHKLEGMLRRHQAAERFILSINPAWTQDRTHGIGSDRLRNIRSTSSSSTSSTILSLGLVIITSIKPSKPLGWCTMEVCRTNMALWVLTDHCVQMKSQRL